MGEEKLLIKNTKLKIKIRKNRSQKSHRNRKSPKNVRRFEQYSKIPFDPIT